MLIGADFGVSETIFTSRLVKFNFLNAIHYLLKCLYNSLVACIGTLNQKIAHWLLGVSGLLG